MAVVRFDSSPSHPLPRIKYCRRFESGLQAPRRSRPISSQFAHKRRQSDDKQQYVIAYLGRKPINHHPSVELSHNTGLRSVQFEHEAYIENLSWTDRILELLLQVRSPYLEEVAIRVIEACPPTATMCWETLNLHDLDEVLNWPQFSRVRKVRFVVPKWEFLSGVDVIVREQMAICDSRGTVSVVPEVWDAHHRVRALWKTV